MAARTSHASAWASVGSKQDQSLQRSVEDTDGRYRQAGCKVLSVAGVEEVCVRGQNNLSSDLLQSWQYGRLSAFLPQAR